MQTSAPVANVIGLGLIGGSVALALGARGWQVHGTDVNDAVVARALEERIISSSTIQRSASLTVVAVPVDAAQHAVQQALDLTDGPVTDVGSVKSPIATAFTSGRFVGGHPMAGSELEGLDGADAAMFESAIWVLTPTVATDDAALSAVAGVIRSLGAEVVALEPEAHDRLVGSESPLLQLTTPHRQWQRSG
jgi:prephenate dehydrogenase